jgi:hypothetical protein
MHLIVGPDTSRREDLADRFGMRRVKPFLCLAGFFFLFQIETQLCPESSQGPNVPAKVVPYCPQNSGYASCIHASK